MSVAGKVRSKVSRAKTGTLFEASDFEGSARAVETALSRMAAEGSVHRIRRGLYFKGGSSRFGPGGVPVASVVYKVCKRGAGPAGVSAARVLGLTTQVPAVEEFAVIKAPENVPGARFRIRRNMARLSANPLEIAILEVLRTWPAFAEVSWEDLRARVRSLADDGVIDLKRLRRIALDEPSPRARELVGALTADLAKAA